MYAQAGMTGHPTLQRQKEMKTTFRNALCLGTFLSFALMSGIPAANAAIGACPATAFNGVSFVGPTNTVTGLAINDECTAVFAARSTGVVEVRTIAGSATGTINVGASPVGMDTSVDGTVLYVATASGLTVVNLNNQATWAAPPQVSPPFNVGRRPQYVAVATNSSVFIASDGAAGQIQLLQYDPSANAYRNRTSEIPGGIASAVLKSNADRTRINGIVSVSGQAYAYDRVTDTFVTATATTTVAADGTVSTLNAAGNLRYSVNPSSVAGRSTLAVTNVRTGAVIARFTINESVPVSLPNALVVSADGSQAGVITASGFQLVDIAPAVNIRTMVLSTLYAPSYIRVHNTGAVAGTVRITLRDAFSGGALGVWTSPSIPAGAELQFPVATIESALNITTNRPFRYAVDLEAPAGFFGYMQNIVWNQATGTLSNLSSCDRDIVGTGALDVALVATDSTQLSGVHSSSLGGYPSQIHIASTSNAAQTVVLDIYNANTGALLGSYTSASIAAGGQLTLAVSDIEAAAGISASASTPHYVVIARAPFQGFLQNRLLNQTTGTFADMSAACVINGELQTREAASSITGATTNTVQISSIYSTSQTATQSFLRLSNESATAQTATVALSVPEGTRVWTSPSIAAGAEIQVPISTIEAEVPAFTKPAFYSATVTMGFQGSVQHVVYRPSTATFSNLSTCVGEGSDDLTRLSAVHSSLIADFPSYIVINNNLAFPAATQIVVSDARTGAALGTFITDAINGKGNIVYTMAGIENALGLTASPGRYHYNLTGRITELNGVTPSFFLQHLVLNRTTNTLEDMTKTCRPN